MSDTAKAPKWHMSLRLVEDGSEKTNRDWGVSVRFLNCQYSDHSRMAVVGSNCSAVFKGEMPSRENEPSCRPRGRMPLSDITILSERKKESQHGYVDFPS